MHSPSPADTPSSCPRQAKVVANRVVNGLPQKHFPEVDQVPEEVGAKVFATLSKVAKSVRQLSDVTGYNVIQSNGKVNHRHFHCTSHPALCRAVKPNLAYHTVLMLLRLQRVRRCSTRTSTSFRGARETSW